MRRAGLPVALLLSGGTAPALVLAQVPPQTLPELGDDLHMNEPLQSRFDRRGLVEPLEIGPFQISAQVLADIGFNDNVFAQPTGTKADLYFDLGSKISATYRYDEFSAELDTYLLDHQFLTLTTEDYWEGNGSLTLRESPSPDFSYFIQDGLARLAVPRTDPNPIDGRTPATYLLYNALGGVTFGSGVRNLVTATIGYDQTVFDPIVGLFGPLDTAERNRTEVYGDFRWDHIFYGQQKWFIEARPDTRQFEQDEDTAGFRQSSSGARIDTGMVLEPNGVFLITISTGWQEQIYNERRWGQIGEPDANLEVQWTPTQLTQLDAKYVHEYAEDIDINAPGYTHDQMIFTLQHELRRNFLASFYASADFRELERSFRRYEVIDVGPRLQYRLPDQITLGFNYDRWQLSSNTINKYNDDIALFTVKKTF